MIESCLIRVATAQDLDHRAEHDRQIEVKAPVVDVPDVELYSSLHGPNRRRRPATPIDLCTPSNARFHALAKCVVRNDLIKVAPPYREPKR
jgi:hypothetical protein